MRHLPRFFSAGLLSLASSSQSFISGVNALRSSSLLAGRQKDNDRAKNTRRADPVPAEENVPTLTTISASMDALEKKIGSLNLDLSGIQNNITALETVTQDGMRELADINSKVGDASTMTTKNSEIAGQLEINAKTIEGKLANNTAKLEALEKYLGKLGENIIVLGSSGTDTAQRVIELERMVNETVPTGTINKNMQEIEKKVTGFEEALKTGVDKEIQASLKGSIEEMRKEVRTLGRKIARKIADGEQVSV